MPQSRVRLFIIGSVLNGNQLNTSDDCPILNCESDARPPKVRRFIRENRDIRWSIRNIPMLPNCPLKLDDIVDHSATWWPYERSEYLFNQMFDRHKEIIQEMMQRDSWFYGTVFRRMRVRDGIKQSTAELRADGIAGCLRTPKGGSARQILVRAGKGQFDARLINEIESARLMGAEDYTLPTRFPLNKVLFGFGDAVCVPVISWIAQHYLNPMFNELTRQEDGVIHLLEDTPVALPESA